MSWLAGWLVGWLWCVGVCAWWRLLTYNPILFLFLILHLLYLIRFRCGFSVRNEQESKSLEGWNHSSYCPLIWLLKCL